MLTTIGLLIGAAGFAALVALYLVDRDQGSDEAGEPGRRGRRLRLRPRSQRPGHDERRLQAEQARIERAWDEQHLRATLQEAEPGDGPLRQP